MGTRPSQRTPIIIIAGLSWAFGFSGLGCKNDPAVGCASDGVFDVKDSPLAAMENVKLIRTGATFGLVGLDKDTIRWGQIGETGGAIEKETTMTVPARVVGPFFALTGKAAPGDQLLVVIGVKRPPKAAGTGEFIEVQTITQDAGGEPSAPKRLLDLPALPDAETKLRLVMGTSVNGKRAALAWGFDGQPVPPMMLIMRPDGEALGDAAMPTSVKQIGPTWNCLAFVPSRTEFSLSAVVPPATEANKPEWHLLDFADDGRLDWALAVSPETDTMDCPVVTPNLPRPKVKGYSIAWQTPVGTYFADFKTEPDADGGDRQSTYSRIVKAAVRFGGPSKQPPLACLAPIGTDYALTYASPNSPQVDRFDYRGTPKGGTFFLPLQGESGPLSAWPMQGGFFVTYVDKPQAGGFSTDVSRKRVLIKVGCGSNL